MGWLYVPGLEEWNSDSDSPWESDTELLVTLSGKPTRRPSSWRGWRTRLWIRLLSGTISRPLTAARGVARWISSLQVCPVNPIVKPGNGRDTLTSARSGPSSSGSSRRSSPLESSSKTSRPSCATSVRCMTSFEDWASTLLRRCSTPRQSPARRISAGDSLFLLPTPSAQCYGWNQGTGGERRGPKRPGLDGLVRMLPVPGSSMLGTRPSSTDAATGAEPAGHRGQLNPRFSEWLMDLPVGWTSFERSATQSFQEWWTLHILN